MKNKKWTKVPDKFIINIWVCPSCNRRESYHPDWYQDNGTPTCECDDEMEYSHTEVKQ